MTTLPKVLRDVSLLAENTKSETNDFNEHTKLNEPLFFPYGCEKHNQEEPLEENTSRARSSFEHSNENFCFVLFFFIQEQFVFLNIRYQKYIALRY